MPIAYSATDLLYGLCALLFAGLVSFSLTPLVRILGFRIGAVDFPDKKRHFHKMPTPRCGGVAIFLAFFAGVAIFCPLTNDTLGLLCGTFLIMCLGLWDDTKNLKPLQKFAGQIVAAVVPVLFGIRIEHINLFGWQIEFGAFAIPVTIFWIVVLTNAVNLIDGLDGLACGVCTISSICLLLCALVSAQVAGVAMIVAILAGACAGFLPFNSFPAKIFMGDSGALSLGFVLAVLSIQGLFKFNAVVSFWVPLLIFAFPIGDTAISFFRRLLRRESPFQADRKHLHYRLLAMGFTQKQVVAVLYSFSATLSVAAVLFSMERFLAAALVFVLAMFLLLITYLVCRQKTVSDRLKVEAGLSVPEEQKTEDAE